MLVSHILLLKHKIMLHFTNFVGNAWAQQLDVVNVSTTANSIDSLPLQTPILVQNVPVSIANTNAQNSKIRGASDQPGKPDLIVTLS